MKKKTTSPLPNKQSNNQSQLILPTHTPSLLGTHSKTGRLHPRIAKCQDVSRYVE
jgi:hypothetical protein